MIPCMDVQGTCVIVIVAAFGISVFPVMEICRLGLVILGKRNRWSLRRDFYGNKENR